MIEIDESSLRRIQMIQLEMLVEVDRICKKCDIKYNIIAGTLLAAVRHKGSFRGMMMLMLNSSGNSMEN